MRTLTFVASETNVNGETITYKVHMIVPRYILEQGKLLTNEVILAAHQMVMDGLQELVNVEQEEGEA